MDFLYKCIRLIVRPVISKIWIKEVTGVEYIPRFGPAVLAINHQSYFDFFCLAALCPRNIHFLAAEKFFDHWLWGILMRVTRQVRVDRISHDKKEMHSLIHAHIDRGNLVGIFPEGTRSPHENEMLKAFSGVARYGLHKKVPIIPVGIKGTFSVLSRHSKKIKFAKIISIHIGEPMQFNEYYNGALTDLDYRKVTHRVMQRISVLSDRKYSHDV